VKRNSELKKISTCSGFYHKAFHELGMNMVSKTAQCPACFLESVDIDTYQPTHKKKTTQRRICLAP